MRPLTKREKILLYAMAVIAVIAGMVLLVIQPAMKASEALDAQVIERQESIASMTAKLSAAASVQESIDEYAEKIAAEEQYYLPMMTNNELDEYITRLLQTHGLVALSLEITKSEMEGVTGMVHAYDVETEALGTMTQFMLLIDTTRELDGIRIKQIAAVADKTATPSPSPSPVPNRRARITPTPIVTPATPVPMERNYVVKVIFSVHEYDPNAVQNVELLEETELEETPVPAEATDAGASTES